MVSIVKTERQLFVLRFVEVLARVGSRPAIPQWLPDWRAEYPPGYISNWTITFAPGPIFSGFISRLD